MFRPFTPLPDVIPPYVIEFLKLNPENSMSYYSGNDPVTQQPLLYFFAKGTYSDFQYITDSSTIQAELSLEYRSDDPIVGPAVFAKLICHETTFHPIGNAKHDIRVAIGPYARYHAESEFPLIEEALNFLEMLVRQPQWIFVFVDNNCEVYYNAKIFPNPLSPSEQQMWLEKIQQWQKEM